MVTILRAGGFRFVIYVDDHEPAHVYGDGEVRIDLVRLVVLSQRGMKKRDVEKALAAVAENRALLRRRWEKIHG